MPEFVKIEKEVDGTKVQSEVLAESLPAWEGAGWTAVENKSEGSEEVALRNDHRPGQRPAPQQAANENNEES